MRKQFFRKVDLVLPRWLAKSPYLFSLGVVRGLLGLGFGLKVWNRNSTKTNSFVFGVSDLDLTILGCSGTSFNFLRETLFTLKQVFIFLGETNYYDQNDLAFILKRINTYELKRDPCLECFSQEGKTASSAEKFVFIQRMLFSDVHSLKAFPELRQAKWRHHFKLTGVEIRDEIITLETILNILKELSGNNSRIGCSLNSWITQVFNKDFNPYRSSLGEGFSIIAPYFYLWFEEKDERDLLHSLTEFEKEVIRRQIDWEFWGLYTQRYHHLKPSVRSHLLRLVKLLSFISAEEAQVLQKEINLVFKES